MCLVELCLVDLRLVDLPGAARRGLIRARAPQPRERGAEYSARSRFEALLMGRGSLAMRARISSWTSL